MAHVEGEDAAAARPWSRLQRLPDELLSLVGACLEDECFGCFVESLDLPEIRARVVFPRCYVADERRHLANKSPRRLPAEIKQHIRWRAYATQFGCSNFPPAWLDLKSLRGLRVQCTQEEAQHLILLDVPQLETLEIQIDGDNRVAQVLRILENFPRLQTLSFETIRGWCLEADALELLASKKVVGLLSLTVKNLDVNLAAFEQLIISQKRKGPSVFRLVEWCDEHLMIPAYQMTRTFHIPPGQDTFLLRSFSDRAEPFARIFLDNVPKFATDPNNLLPYDVCPTLYGACEYIVDGQLVGNDAAMDEFIDLFPNREVVYVAPNTRDLVAVQARYHGRRVVLVVDGEVLSMGVQPPKDLQPIIEALRKQRSGDKLCVLDEQRKPAKWHPDAPQYGWQVAELPFIDPSMPRRRWLHSALFDALLSFDPKIARKNVQSFLLDASFASLCAFSPTRSNCVMKSQRLSTLATQQPGRQYVFNKPVLRGP